MKKILIIPSWYPTEKDHSHGIFFENEAIVLSSIYDVKVYLPPKRKNWRMLLSQTAVLDSNNYSRNGVSIYQERDVIIPPRLPQNFVDKYYYAFLRRYFKRLINKWGRPDLVHAYASLDAGYIAMGLGKFFGIPTVIKEVSGPFATLLESKESRKKVREILSSTKKIIAVSPSMKNEILNFDKNLSIDIVGCVARSEWFSDAGRAVPNTSKNTIKFLTVGRLTKSKGIIYLIAASYFLKQKGFKNFRLKIEGIGPESAFLKQMVNALGMSNICNFLGFISRNELMKEFNNCDVFILPSLGETFGVVTLEAMACGKPVISTKCGGPEFVVTPETGILVPPADSEGLANAMEGFMTGKYKFEPTKIRESVKSRFGENAFLENISRVYEEVWSSN